MPYSTDLGNDSLFLMSWGRRRSCALDEKEWEVWSKWRQLKQFELSIELLPWSINFNQLFMSIFTVIIPLRIYKRIKKHHGWSRRIPYWQVPGFIYFPSFFFVVRFADHYTLQKNTLLRGLQLILPQPTNKHRWWCSCLEGGTIHKKTPGDEDSFLTSRCLFSSRSSWGWCGRSWGPTWENFRLNPPIAASWFLNGS